MKLRLASSSAVRAPWLFGLAALAAFTPQAIAAQTSTNPIRRWGMVSTWAAGLSLAPDTVAPNTTRDTVLKAPNSNLIPTAPWQVVAGANSPDYSIASMFPTFADIEVDAHSSGNGVIPRMTAQEELEIDQNAGWFAVVASVTRSSQGNVGSHFRRALTNHGHPGSQLASYYFDGSTGINAQLVGRTLLEATGPRLNYSGIGTTTLPDIDSLDYGIGMITHNVSSPNALFFRNRVDYFFSVSLEWADQQVLFNVPFARASTNASAATLLPDPRHVYRIQWNGTSWSLPIVWREGASLGLLQGADLDALDVDLFNQTMIYSAAGNDALPSQIMFVQTVKFGVSSPQAQPPIPLPGGTNTTAEDELDLGNDPDDDVDALCGIDPESGSTAMLVGIALEHDPRMGEPMGLSLARRLDLPGSADVQLPQKLVVDVTGWGGGIPISGATVFEVHAGPIMVNGQFNQAGWVFVEAVARGDMDGTITREWPLPAGADGTGAPAYVRATNYAWTDGGWIVNGATWAAQIRP